MLPMHQNLVGAGRLLIGNKAAPVGTIGIEEDPSIKVLQVASVVAKNTYKVAGVLAHYIVFGKESLIVSEGKPMRAVFGEAEDAVIFCYKLGGKMVYLFGMTIPALLDWTPPSKATEMVNESALLQSWKATHSDLKELVPLVNTETHKNLVALADKFMSHMPTFAVAKIKDSKAAARWCANSFSANVRVIVDASEVEERKRAAEKSNTAGDKSRVESAAGGAQAKKFWSERKRLLLTVAPYYEDSFSERFIVVALHEETGQPTAETLSKLRSELECASSRMCLSPLAPRLSPLASQHLSARACTAVTGRMTFLCGCSRPSMQQSPTLRAATRRMHGSSTVAARLASTSSRRRRGGGAGGARHRCHRRHHARRRRSRRRCGRRRCARRCRRSTHHHQHCRCRGRDRGRAYLGTPRAACHGGRTTPRTSRR